MRIVSLGILFLFIVGCATSRSPSDETGEHGSDLTLDQAMDIVGQLQIGMPEQEVVAILKTNGLRQSWGLLGSSFNWGEFFSLSEKHQLCVDFTTTLKGPDPEHANGILKHIYIETVNEKDPPNIVEITPHVERNPTFKFDVKSKVADQASQGTARKLAVPGR